MTRRILLAGCATLAATGLSLAADYSLSPLYSPNPISGYVDVNFALGPGSESGTFPGGSFTESWTTKSPSAAARAAIILSPHFSAQIDAWAYWVKSEGSGSDGAPYTLDGTASVLAGAGHLTYWTQGGHLIGGLVSIGGRNETGSTGSGSSTYGNAAIEAAYNASNWRVYGQAGYVHALSGDPSDDNEKDVYVGGVLSYYLNPDLVIAGTLGFDHFTADNNGGTSVNEVSWGIRLEHKLATLPIGGYIAYYGWHWSGSDLAPQTWSGNSHLFVVGARFLIHQDTLRSVDQSVGLIDINPVYGDFAH